MDRIASGRSFFFLSIYKSITVVNIFIHFQLWLLVSKNSLHSGTRFFCLKSSNGIFMVTTRRLANKNDKTSSKKSVQRKEVRRKSWLVGTRIHVVFFIILII